MPLFAIIGGWLQFIIRVCGYKVSLMALLTYSLRFNSTSFDWNRLRVLFINNCTRQETIVIACTERVGKSTGVVRLVSTGLGIRPRYQWIGNKSVTNNVVRLV